MHGRADSSVLVIRVRIRGFVVILHNRRNDLAILVVQIVNLGPPVHVIGVLPFLVCPHAVGISCFRNPAIVIGNVFAHAHAVAVVMGDKSCPSMFVRGVGHFAADQFSIDIHVGLDAAVGKGDRVAGFLDRGILQAGGGQDHIGHLTFRQRAHDIRAQLVRSVAHGDDRGQPQPDCRGADDDPICCYGAGLIAQEPPEADMLRSALTCCQTHEKHPTLRSIARHKTLMRLE